MQKLNNGSAPLRPIALSIPTWHSRQRDSFLGLLVLYIGWDEGRMYFISIGTPGNSWIKTLYNNAKRTKLQITCMYRASPVAGRNLAMQQNQYNRDRFRYHPGHIKRQTNQFAPLCQFKSRHFRNRGCQSSPRIKFARLISGSIVLHSDLGHQPVARISRKRKS